MKKLPRARASELAAFAPAILRCPGGAACERCARSPRAHPFVKVAILCCSQFRAGFWSFDHLKRPNGPNAPRSEWRPPAWEYCCYRSGATALAIACGEQSWFCKSTGCGTYTRPFQHVAHTEKHALFCNAFASCVGAASHLREACRVAFLRIAAGVMTDCSRKGGAAIPAKEGILTQHLGMGAAERRTARQALHCALRRVAVASATPWCCPLLDLAAGESCTGLRRRPSSFWARRGRNRFHRVPRFRSRPMSPQPAGCWHLDSWDTRKLTKTFSRFGLEACSSTFRRTQIINCPVITRAERAKLAGHKAHTETLVFSNAPLPALSLTHPETSHGWVAPTEANVTAAAEAPWKGASLASRTSTRFNSASAAGWRLDTTVRGAGAPPRASALRGCFNQRCAAESC